MTYNLYIDVLFCINFIMDCLLLAVVRRILKVDATALRIILGGALGAVWAVFIAVFPVFPVVLEAAVHYVVISGLMVSVAFRLRSWKEIVKAVLALYLAAVTLGGGMYALYQHTRVGYYVELVIRGNAVEAMPVYIFILLAAGTYFGVRCIWLNILEIRKRKSHLFQVVLYYQGKTETVTALMDTGNHLFEPVSHKPVHLITYEACRQLCESVSNVVYIPFQAVGTKNGLIPGVFLDRMEIEQEGEKKTVDKPLVAICRQPLSPGGEYQMLLHEDL